MTQPMRALLSVLLSLPLLCAQQATETTPATKPLRVHIIGASVSGGFLDGPAFGARQQGDSINLQRLLNEWYGEHAEVTIHPPMEMWMLFKDPEKVGEKEVAMALRAEPDIVLAVDFPFWFAYGYVQGDEQQARNDKLTVGLDLLSRIEVPIVIGDLPDMTGAARRMLSPRQIPSAAVLKQLNERLAAYAQEHAHVTLVPLAGLVKQLKADGAPLPLAAGELKTKPGALLQEDQLHATRLGMALLGFRLQDALRHALPKDHALRSRQWTFEQFVEAAGADGELEEIVEPAEAGR